MAVHVKAKPKALNREEYREMKKIIQVCVIVFLVLSVFESASAEEKTAEKAAEKAVETPATEKNWKFNLAPFYLWAISISGDGQFGTNSGNLDVSFSDIFDKLDSAFIFNFQGLYRNRWGFNIDYNYLGLSNSAVIPTRGIPPGIPPYFTASMDLRLDLVQVAGFYRLDQATQAFDFYAGGRYTRLAPEILLGPLYVDKSKSWVDPLVGARWVWPFAENWALALSGDIGGFGVGSDLTWQGIFRIDWQPWKNVALTAGYRALYQDYEDGTQGANDYFAVDATYHGPLFGIEFRW